jgi:flagellum-specific peptidoglycan hydrolase FlgJ
MTFRPTNTPQPIAPVANTWEGVITAASKAGAKFPQVVAAQWALESGYGKHTSGKNNYFGIKGKDGEGTLVSTTEFVGGMEIKVDAWFKNFTTLDACVSYIVDRWYKDYKGYRGVNRASTPEECAELLVREGYATDPLYATKLQRLLKEHD